MGFILRFAELGVVLSMATSVCYGEVLGTFEGRVNVTHENVGASLPAEIAKGDRVIGCFRYRPEDAQIEEGPDERGFWRYRFRDVPPRNVFALSIGGLVWRSGETFRITVANEQRQRGAVHVGPIDWFVFSYGIKFWRELTVLAQHPGLPPGGGGNAWFQFIDRGSPPAFLRSTELPDTFEAFDFAGVDHVTGSVGAYGEASGWSVHFDLDPASVVINGRPALPGAVPPETADEAAGLCSEAVVSDASEATETR